jgi:hypothetical protein
MTSYYGGDLNNKEDLAKYNLEPFDKKINTHAGIAKAVARDPEVQKLQLKIEVHNIIIKFCESIIHMISGRGYQLSTAVKWEEFMKGTRYT